MTFMPARYIGVVVDRFTGDELIALCGAAVDAGNRALADVYALAIAEKTVREEVDVGANEVRN